MSIRVVILTVSDTASSTADADKSGPAIRNMLAANNTFACTDHRIVSDDIHAIQAAVTEWCSRGDVDWVITTGGTGFGRRDQTPEALTPLIERPAPGLVHLLLSSSLQHTPLAALSRPVAGTIKNTLIVTLPGSVKAVTENMEALLADGVVGHAIELVRGGSGKQVHATLASTHSHPHHHYHHHEHKAPTPRSNLAQNPDAGVSARHRISPYPLISLEDALSMIQKQVSPLEAQRKPVTWQLRGHVLAEEVYAPQNVPSTSTTSVDGYALRSTDPPGIYKVLTSATHKTSDPLSQGFIYRINTGGPLPAGADTVLMVEDTRLVSADGDGEEKEVECLVQVPPGENVRAPGSDVRKGELALQKGTIISSGGGEIGTLAFVGRKEVEVYKRPVVAILSTGNELLDLQNPSPLSGDDWGGIWDTNRPSLHAALEGLGYDVVDLGIVADNIPAHVAALQRGLESADMIISTGGTSMGPSDLLKPVLEQHLNGIIHFGRVTVKPGKPTTFATVGTKPVFALPGNPASALVTFYVFVLPALRRLGGFPSERCVPPRVRVVLKTAMALDARTEFHRAVLRADVSNGVVYAESTGGQRSSRAASLAGANGFVVLPMRTEVKPRLEAGEQAEAVVIGDIL
ncbi:Molybdopterin molybdenumtransferase [Mycena kentingensis (nom. inval.)]|nr:Molybdopterin molybdenumtransferase [Mycena kentingensis (nom. inval.)]